MLVVTYHFGYLSYHNLSRKDYLAHSATTGIQYRSCCIVVTTAPPRHLRQRHAHSIMEMRNELTARSLTPLRRDTATRIFPIQYSRYDSSVSTRAATSDLPTSVRRQLKSAKSVSPSHNAVRHYVTTILKVSVIEGSTASIGLLFGGIHTPHRGLSILG